MACPFCSYARVHVEDGENCCHFQIHYAAADQANHEENRAGDFKHFNFAIVEHVAGQRDREEHAKNRDGEHGDSVNWINGELISADSLEFGFLLPERPVVLSQARRRSCAADASLHARQTNKRIDIKRARIVEILLERHLHDGSVKSIGMA